MAVAETCRSGTCWQAPACCLAPARRPSTPGQVDEGWTRGEGAGIQYCCLYFARGICHHGTSCNYLHRVPTEEMELRHRTDYGRGTQCVCVGGGYWGLVPTIGCLQGKIFRHCCRYMQL